MLFNKSDQEIYREGMAINLEDKQRVKQVINNAPLLVGLSNFLLNFLMLAKQNLYLGNYEGYLVQITFMDYLLRVVILRTAAIRRIYRVRQRQIW